MPLQQTGSLRLEKTDKQGQGWTVVPPKIKPACWAPGSGTAGSRPPSSPKPHPPGGQEVCSWARLGRFAPGSACTLPCLPFLVFPDECHVTSILVSGLEKEEE